jgi:peptide/nickel transport system permease protein
MISAASSNNHSALAGELPDILPPLKSRTGVLGFIVRYPTVAIGGTLFFLLVLAGIFAPFLTSADPNALAVSQRARPPSPEHWFGTDLLGRDVYSRVIYGARVSLVVGFAVAFFSSVGGLVVGLVAGFIRWTDGIIMRIMDGLMAIPPILLAIALLAVTRGSIGNVIIAITIAEIPRVARLVRGIVLTLRDQPFIDGAVAIGGRTMHIILRHILPNTFAAMTVQATYIGASAMVLEAVLSFIGAGIQSDIPSWGNIMAEGRALWQIKPHIIFFPALFLSMTILFVNILGDGLNDAFGSRIRNVF